MQNHSVSRIAEENDLNAIPPSSLPRIPQSVSRSSREEQTKNPLFSIQATPTRKPTSNITQRGSGFLNVTTVKHGGYQLLSPLQVGRSSSQLFNLGPETNGPPSPWSSQAVQDTPAKQRTGAVLVHGHPIPSTPIFSKEHPVPSTPIFGKENMGMIEGASDGLKLSFEKTQDVSIYKSLGWDDADDLDDLV